MSIDLGSAKGKIEIDTSGVFSEMQKAGKSIRSFQSNVATAMVGVGVAIAGATAAAGLMRKGWQTLGEGAELNAVEGRYKRLAASIGSSSDAMMARLEEATGGMISNAQLMASATDIMSLGLGKTEDQTVRLASVVGKLGWDMQQVVLTMANNSKMRLDALGLSVEDVNKRTAELRATGMSLDEAFDLAVIEAGEAKIQLLGDAATTSAGKIKIMTAQWQDAVAAFKSKFAEAAADELDAVAAAMEGGGAGFERGMEQLGGRAGSIMGKALTAAAVSGLRIELEGVGEELRGLGVEATTLNAVFEQAMKDTGHTLLEVGLGGEAALEVYERQLELLDELYGKQLEMRDLLSDDDAWSSYYGQIKATTRETEAVSRASLNLGAHLAIAGERFKEAADGGGKFGSQLDAIGDKAARAAAELEATAQRAQAYAEAFGAVEGGYTTQLPDADEPLVTPERTVNVTTQISGPTEQQRQAVEAYTAELEGLRDRYFELTSGIGTFGMEQEKLDAAIAATAGEIAHYEGLLAGIPPTVNDVSTSQQGLSVNVDAVRQGIYNQLVDMQAAPEIIAAYAAATGIMSEAQAEAVLQAAAVKVKIDELAQSIAAGMPIDKALADLDAFIAKIETGVTPAATAMATDVPLAMAPMSEELSTQATAAGEAVPTNIAAGITDNLEQATTAATDAADAITQAVRDAHGIESPSSVFAEIGGQDIEGFIVGAESMQGDAVAAMDAIGQATIDAWDATVEAADGIGVAIMDGVIAGVESKRGELVEKMKEIAREAYQVAMDELNAHSPSELFIEMGAETIIGAIIIGLDEEKDTLYGKMTEIAGELYQVATAGLAWLGDPLELQLRAQGDAIDELSEQIEEALAPFGDLDMRLGRGIVERMQGMDAESLRASLYGLRYSNEYQTSGVVRDEVERLIALADERAAAEQAVLDVQEQLADVEERRLELEREQARLSYLQAQIDLVDTIHELGLSTSILEGLELGLDANGGDLAEAMRRVVQQLIEAAEDELEIASPSRVGYGLTDNFMNAMTRGITDNARDPVAALVETYDAMREASERMALAGMGPGAGDWASSWPGGGSAAPSATELLQRVTVYGGLNVTMQGGPVTDPLREQYFAWLGYQR